MVDYFNSGTLDAMRGGFPIQATGSTSFSTQHWVVRKSTTYPDINSATGRYYAHVALETGYSYSTNNMWHVMDCYGSTCYQGSQVRLKRSNVQIQAGSWSVAGFHEADNSQWTWYTDGPMMYYCSTRCHMVGPNQYDPICPQYTGG